MNSLLDVGFICMIFDVCFRFVIIMFLFKMGMKLSLCIIRGWFLYIIHTAIYQEQVKINFVHVLLSFALCCLLLRDISLERAGLKTVFPSTWTSYLGRLSGAWISWRYWMPGLLGSGCSLTSTTWPLPVWGGRWLAPASNQFAEIMYD